MRYADGSAAGGPNTASTNDYTPPYASSPLRLPAPPANDQSLRRSPPRLGAALRILPVASLSTQWSDEE
jgi:hypothetical protein